MRSEIPSRPADSVESVQWTPDGPVGPQRDRPSGRVALIGSGAPDRAAAARKCARLGESRLRTATSPARGTWPPIGAGAPDRKATAKKCAIFGHTAKQGHTTAGGTPASVQLRMDLAWESRAPSLTEMACTTQQNWHAGVTRTLSDSVQASPALRPYRRFVISPTNRSQNRLRSTSITTLTRCVPAGKSAGRSMSRGASGQ